MEFITSEYLEKYEKILQKIHNEYEACKQLEKQIKNENNKIVAANLAKHEDMKNKVFRVNVRVFDSVFEIFDHYGSVWDDLLDYKNCKFYLVEVYVSTVFQDKLAEQRWILNIKLNSTNKIVCQSLNLKSEAYTYPLIAILPIESSEKVCKVEATLTLPSSDFWTSINLQDVEIDVSYHFKISNENIYKSKSLTMNVIDICKSYCKNSNILQSLNNKNIREATFLYSTTVIDLLKFLIWNSYHRVDPEMFSALQKSDTLNFEVKTHNLDTDTIQICFNPQDNILKITTTIQLLYELKKYFIKATNQKQVSLNRRTLKVLSVCITIFFL